MLASCAHKPAPQLPALATGSLGRMVGPFPIGKTADRESPGRNPTTGRGFADPRLPPCTLIHVLDVTRPASPGPAASRLGGPSCVARSAKFGRPGLDPGTDRAGRPDRSTYALTLQTIGMLASDAILLLV